MTITTEDSGTTTTSTGTGVTLGVHQLGAALLNVLPHASKDGTLPILGCVRFEVTPDTVTLIATDRYSMGVQEIPCENGSTMDLNLTVDFCKQLVKACKAQRGGYVHISAHGDGSVTAQFADCAFTSQTLVATFPKWRSLIDAPTPAPVGSVALGPFNLVKFGKIYDHNMTALRIPTVVFTFNGDNRPVSVSVGGLGSFRALVMPIRLSN